MKNPTNDDAYHALFRSYEDSNKCIKELEMQCGHFRLTISKLELLLVRSGLNVAELQAEVTRLREANEAWHKRVLLGGCARGQHTTQYCGELRSLVTRLTALAEEFQTEETWDGKRNDALRYCAGRLREAIGGGDEPLVGLLDIADAIIAEREVK